MRNQVLARRQVAPRPGSPSQFKTIYQLQTSDILRKSLNVSAHQHRVSSQIDKRTDRESQTRMDEISECGAYLPKLSKALLDSLEVASC